MAGETLREMAVLCAVFFMLDNLMKDNRAQAFSVAAELYVLLGCIIAYSLGVVFEVFRPSSE